MVSIDFRLSGLDLRVDKEHAKTNIQNLIQLTCPAWRTSKNMANTLKKSTARDIFAAAFHPSSASTFARGTTNQRTVCGTVRHHLACLSRSHCFSDTKQPVKQTWAIIWRAIMPALSRRSAPVIKLIATLSPPGGDTASLLIVALARSRLVFGFAVAKSDECLPKQ
ncbi:hypothetical protein ACJJTC_006408 [Scirpophaga incertulas]